MSPRVTDLLLAGFYDPRRRTAISPSDGSALDTADFSTRWVLTECHIVIYSTSVTATLPNTDRRAAMALGTALLTVRSNPVTSRREVFGARGRHAAFGIMAVRSAHRGVLGTLARRATDKAIDLAGVACAFALAEIVRAVAEQRGPVEAICDHPTTVHETIPAYCKAHGYRLTVTPEIYPLDTHTYRMRIEPPAGG